jgi:Methylase involved in ubiquinone/menaquinone biosynthesis
MSSPIAKRNKGFLDKLLIAIHKKTSHSKRVGILSTLFVEVIKSLNSENKVLRLLDVGCGDMAIAKALASKYEKLQFICIDIYPNIEHWNNYLEFDGKKIPFEDKEFDVVLFSDVLHHDSVNMKTLLMEAKRVSNFIVIKDHFEYGLWSRRILQFADFIGNYGYGGSIPRHYFSKQSFLDLLDECRLEEIKQQCPIQLYLHSNMIKLFFKSKYQFISIIH